VEKEDVVQMLWQVEGTRAVLDLILNRVQAAKFPEWHSLVYVARETYLLGTCSLLDSRVPPLIWLS
ncbi:hypothetical protein WAJ71_22095, partial [Acinetobacter baumannii]